MTAAVKVEFYVYNQFERAIVSEALTIIEKAREAQYAQVEQARDKQAQAEETAPAGDAQGEESVARPSITTEEKIVGHISPEGAVAKVPLPSAVTVNEADLAALVQKSLDTRGLAETRELLAPITGGKRWRETDPALWPAIKEVLEAK